MQCNCTNLVGFIGDASSVKPSSTSRSRECHVGTATRSPFPMGYRFRHSIMEMEICVLQSASFDPSIGGERGRILDIQKWRTMEGQDIESNPFGVRDPMAARVALCAKRCIAGRMLFLFGKSSIPVHHRKWVGSSANIKLRQKSLDSLAPSECECIDLPYSIQCLEGAIQRRVLQH
jgi:hypothetical protein